MIHTVKGNIWFSIIFNMNSVLSPSDPLQTSVEPDCPPTTMPEASEQSHLGALQALRQSANPSLGGKAVAPPNLGGKAIAPPLGKYFLALNKRHVQEVRLEAQPAASKQQTERTGTGASARMGRLGWSCSTGLLRPLFPLTI